jgi:hypothetical protein
VGTLRSAIFLFAASAAPVAAQVSLPAPVEQAELAQDAFSVGTLTPGLGALDPTLWKGADSVRIAYLLNLTPESPKTPSLGEALRRVLLSPGAAPENSPPSLGGRKLLALARAGFVEEARTIASLSTSTRNEPFATQALATADLFEGKLDDACRRNANLAEDRDAPFWVKLRVLCYAAAGKRDAADLTLNILRDQGALSSFDETLLTAVSTGLKPIISQGPENALHLAAMRQLNVPVAPGQLSSTGGGVLAALARDANFPLAARIEAANRAAAMGVLKPSELAAIYEAVDLDIADLARAADVATAAPDDPRSDVLLYQAVRQMTAPEFLRDKAARMSEAIANARTFPRLVAASQLYAADIVGLEGALVQPADAGRFALAALLAGDSAGAGGWLAAMRGTTGLSELSDTDGAQFIDLVNLLGILDRSMATTIAQQNGVALATGFAGTPAAAGDAATEARRARIIEGAFDAAIASIEGQAALAALAMSANAPLSDPISAAVVNQSLRAARMNDLRRRVELETAVMARLGQSQVAPSPAAASVSTGAAASQMGPAKTPVGAAQSGTPTPRIKPKPGP